MNRKTSSAVGPAAPPKPRLPGRGWMAVTLGLVPCLLFGLPTGSNHAEQVANRRIDALMTRKLNSAQKVLEGLATENYELVQAESARLELYSQEAGWEILQTEDYRRFSQDFRKAADQMEEAAKRKNLDGASMGYIKLTLTCLECHRHVREVRGEASDPPESNRR